MAGIPPQGNGDALALSCDHAVYRYLYVTEQLISKTPVQFPEHSRIPFAYSSRSLSPWPSRFDKWLNGLKVYFNGN